MLINDMLMVKLSQLHLFHNWINLNSHCIPVFNFVLLAITNEDSSFGLKLDMSIALHTDFSELKANCSTNKQAQSKFILLLGPILS